MSLETVADWKDRLSHLCKEDVSLEDVSNCDETPFFNKFLPSKSLISKGDDYNLN